MLRTTGLEDGGVRPLVWLARDLDVSQQERKATLHFTTDTTHTKVYLLSEAGSRILGCTTEKFSSLTHEDSA